LIGVRCSKVKNRLRAVFSWAPLQFNVSMNVSRIAETGAAKGQGYRGTGFAGPPVSPP
jgi:hypothetical protein